MDFDQVLGQSQDLSFENQLAVADAEFMCNEYDAAFKRLIELVRDTSGTERDVARTRLLDYFAIVGPEDQSVVLGLRALSNALF